MSLRFHLQLDKSGSFERGGAKSYHKMGTQTTRSFFPKMMWTQMPSACTPHTCWFGDASRDGGSSPWLEDLVDRRVDSRMELSSAMRSTFEPFFWGASKNVNSSRKSKTWSGPATWPGGPARPGLVARLPERTVAWRPIFFETFGESILWPQKCLKMAASEICKEAGNCGKSNQNTVG